MSDPALARRTAIVTGASQGLGREIALHFLAAGADVAICARSTEDLARTATALRQLHPNRKILAAACDIACPSDVDQLFDTAEAQFGSVDIIVNNAGVHGPIGPIDAVDWREWQRAIAVNLNGTAYSCRKAVQHFKSRTNATQRAKIINLSGGGATAPQPGLTAYGASKAGLVRFTETLAAEVKDFAIDVNAVAPGALATRLMNELHDAGPDKIGADYHNRISRLRDQGGMSMTRAAELCVYLASADSDELTGRLVSAAWDPWPFTPEKKRELMAVDTYTLRRVTRNDGG